MNPPVRKLRVRYAWGLGQWRWDLWQKGEDHDRLIGTGFGISQPVALAFGCAVWRSLR